MLCMSVGIGCSYERSRALTTTNSEGSDTEIAGKSEVGVICVKWGEHENGMTY